MERRYRSSIFTPASTVWTTYAGRPMPSVWHIVAAELNWKQGTVPGLRTYCCALPPSTRTCARRHGRPVLEDARFIASHAVVVRAHHECVPHVKMLFPPAACKTLVRSLSMLRW